MLDSHVPSLCITDAVTMRSLCVHYIACCLRHNHNYVRNLGQASPLQGMLTTFVYVNCIYVAAWLLDQTLLNTIVMVFVINIFGNRNFNNTYDCTHMFGSHFYHRLTNVLFIYIYVNYITLFKLHCIYR